MPGRIECYLHSDNTTKNKAGAMVLVSCQTDFAAKTEEFIDFCKKVAKWACGLQTTLPSDLFYFDTGLEEAHKVLEETLKEKVKVVEIQIMKV